jgi:Brp/Blh family beta-carotene 15,15'-monooxygenase
MKEFKKKHIFYSEHMSFLFWGLLIFLTIYFGTFSSLDLHPWYYNETSPNIFCFFLIATLGVSHGAYDHLKGKKILKILKIKNILIFYFLYISLALLIIFLWIYINIFMLIIFLIVTSFHFGKEDSNAYLIIKKKLTSLLYLIKGSLIIFAPLLFHITDTIEIFRSLYLTDTKFINIIIFFSDNYIFLTLVILSLICNFLIFNNYILGTGAFTESLIILLINFLFSPLVAFTIYFCFIHSIRHIISLILEYEKEDFYLSKGLKKFCIRAWPLTLLTAVLFMVSVYFLTNYYVLNDAILKVIFIGLASLTFPHILLEYLLEKNEK